MRPTRRPSRPRTSSRRRHPNGLAPVPALGRGGACAELLADLRLLGMEPAIALADGREAIQLQTS
jgi:hypothetical protein